MIESLKPLLICTIKSIINKRLINYVNDLFYSAFLQTKCKFKVDAVKCREIGILRSSDKFRKVDVDLQMSELHCGVPTFGGQHPLFGTPNRTPLRLDLE